MRDHVPIYSGLALFLALATFPAWHNLSAGVTAKGPALKLPPRATECVLPADYMRTSHMNLLIGWREQVVRAGARDFTNPGGKHFNMSLTPTCLEQCHGSKADFCDKCHTYAAVSPPCWNCHVDSPPAVRSSAAVRACPGAGCVFEGAL